MARSLPTSAASPNSERSNWSHEPSNSRRKSRKQDQQHFKTTPSGSNDNDNCSLSTMLEGDNPDDELVDDIMEGVQQMNKDSQPAKDAHDTTTSSRAKNKNSVVSTGTANGSNGRPRAKRKALLSQTKNQAVANGEMDMDGSTLLETGAEVFNNPTAKAPKKAKAPALRKPAKRRKISRSYNEEVSSISYCRERLPSMGVFPVPSSKENIPSAAIHSSREASVSDGSMSPETEKLLKLYIPRSHHLKAAVDKVALPNTAKRNGGDQVLVQSKDSSTGSNPQVSKSHGNCQSPAANDDTEVEGQSEPSRAPSMPRQQIDSALSNDEASHTALAPLTDGEDLPETVKEAILRDESQSREPSISHPRRSRPKKPQTDSTKFSTEKSRAPRNRGDVSKLLVQLQEYAVHSATLISQQDAEIRHLNTELEKAENDRSVFKKFMENTNQKIRKLEKRKEPGPSRPCRHKCAPQQKQVQPTTNNVVIYASEIESLSTSVADMYYRVANVESLKLTVDLLSHRLQRIEPLLLQQQYGSLHNGERLAGEALPAATSLNAQSRTLQRASQRRARNNQAGRQDIVRPGQSKTRPQSLAQQENDTEQEEDSMPESDATSSILNDMREEADVDNVSETDGLQLQSLQAAEESQMDVDSEDSQESDDELDLVDANETDSDEHERPDRISQAPVTLRNDSYDVPSPDFGDTVTQLQDYIPQDQYAADLQPGSEENSGEEEGNFDDVNRPTTTQSGMSLLQVLPTTPALRPSKGQKRIQTDATSPITPYPGPIPSQRNFNLKRARIAPEPKQPVSLAKKSRTPQLDNAPDSVLHGQTSNANGSAALQSQNDDYESLEDSGYSINDTLLQVDYDSDQNIQENFEPDQTEGNELPSDVSSTGDHGSKNGLHRTEKTIGSSNRTGAGTDQTNTGSGSVPSTRSQVPEAAPISQPPQQLHRTVIPDSEDDASVATMRIDSSQTSHRRKAGERQSAVPEGTEKPMLDAGPSKVGESNSNNLSHSSQRPIELESSSSEVRGRQISHSLAPGETSNEITLAIGNGVGRNSEEQPTTSKDQNSCGNTLLNKEAPAVANAIPSLQNNAPQSRRPSESPTALQDASLHQHAQTDQLDAPPAEAAAGSTWTRKETESQYEIIKKQREILAQRRRKQTGEPERSSTPAIAADDTFQLPPLPTPSLTLSGTRKILTPPQPRARRPKAQKQGKNQLKPKSGNVRGWVPYNKDQSIQEPSQGDRQGSAQSRESTPQARFLHRSGTYLSTASSLPKPTDENMPPEPTMTPHPHTKTIPSSPFQFGGTNSQYISPYTSIAQAAAVPFNPIIPKLPHEIAKSATRANSKAARHAKKQTESAPPVAPSAAGRPISAIPQLQADLAERARQAFLQDQEMRVKLGLQPGSGSSELFYKEMFWRRKLRRDEKRERADRVNRAWNEMDRREADDGDGGDEDGAF